MIRRALFALALVAFFALAGLPAVWMDTLLARASHNELRLAQTEGSFWHGQGTLALPSADRRQWLPASRIEWRFSLRLAGLELTLREGTHPRLRLIAGVSGFRLEQLELDTPIAPLAAAVPHPLARAAWQGHVLATSPGLACRWNCNGTTPAPPSCPDAPSARIAASCKRQANVSTSRWTPSKVKPVSTATAPTGRRKTGWKSTPPCKATPTWLAACPAS